MELPIAAAGLALALAVWKLRRLVQAELVKIARAPFLLIAFLVLAVGIPLREELGAAMAGSSAGGYSAVSSWLLFSVGAGFGVRVLVFAILVFSALSFAQEFDRGTIKVILTRPVTRTEVFLAKAATLELLAVVLLAFTLYESLLWSLIRGELGHVWKQDLHSVYPTYVEMLGHLGSSILGSILGILAVPFLGVFVSNAWESSGLAVAAALVLWIALGAASEFFGEEEKLYFFGTYQTQGFGTLWELSRGSAAARLDERLFGPASATVPIATSAGLGTAAYLVFRLKNITV